MKRNRLSRWSTSTRARRWLAGSALLTAGAAGGGYLAASTTAGASTASTTSAGSPTSTTTSGGPSSGWPSGAAPRSAPPAHGLDQSGTVTAVGTSSVTIRSSSGTSTTYAVVADSDIDKNGEAKLSNLAVGDKVTFDYVTSGTTKTIAHLHAGSEALDRPTADGNGAGSGHIPGAAPMGGPPGSYPGPSTSGGSTSTAA